MYPSSHRRWLLVLSLSIALPGAPARASGLIGPGQERAMFELVNADRRGAGLPPMRYDSRLAAIARAHSADMAAGGFFDHTSPNSGTVADRVRRAGLPSGPSGENIAEDRGIQEAEAGLMDSPPHRAHILSTRYDTIGIGIATGPSGRLTITQLFRKGGGRAGASGRASGTGGTGEAARRTTATRKPALRAAEDAVPSEVDELRSSR